MTSSPRTRSTRTRLGVASLVAGALLFSVGDLLRRAVEPSGDQVAAAALTRAVADHQAAWSAAGVLSVLAGFLLVVGACTLFGSVQGRGARLTDVGAGMLAVGAVASVGHAVAFFSPYALFARAGTPDDVLTAIDESSERLPMLALLVAAFVVGMMIGTIVLAIGLWRARRVPVWVIVAALVFVVCGSASGVGAGVLGLVAALATFGMAARGRLRERRPVPVAADVTA